MIELPTVVTSTASDSGSKILGLESSLWSGRRTTRLDLNNGRSEKYPWIDTAASVYVEVIGSGILQWVKEKILGFCTQKFVKAEMQVGDDQQMSTVFVNVNSLASRLGIAKEEIYAARDEGKFGEFLEQQQEEYRKKVIMFQRKMENNPVELSEAEAKIAFAAYIRLDAGKAWYCEESNLWVWSNHVVNVYREGKRFFGGEGIDIQEMHNLSTGEREFIRVTQRLGERLITLQEARYQRLNEQYQILKNLESLANHSEQVGPFGVLEVKNTGQKFYFIENFEENLETYVYSNELSFENVDKVIKDLTYALYKVHEKKVVHGNLCFANCFMKKGSDGNLVAAIGGFSQARIEEEDDAFHETASDDIYHLGFIIQNIARRFGLESMYQSLIKEMMKENPSERISALQAWSDINFLDL